LVEESQCRCKRTTLVAEADRDERRSAAPAREPLPEFFTEFVTESVADPAVRKTFGVTPRREIRQEK
jgi:hypothetical protein